MSKRNYNEERKDTLVTDIIRTNDGQYPVQQGSQW
jgi:hypothetical protein